MAPENGGERRGVRRLRLAIDAKLPDSPKARVAVIVWLVTGIVVALLVPVFLGVVVCGTLHAP